jgi:hypothetical protein
MQGVAGIALTDRPRMPSDLATAMTDLKRLHFGASPSNPRWNVMGWRGRCRQDADRSQRARLIRHLDRQITVSSRGCLIDTQLSGISVHSDDCRSQCR